MEFSSKAKRSTVVIAGLTLLTIGVSIIFSTWQNLRQQDKVYQQHLALNARSIAQTAENSFHRWRMPRHGHDGVYNKADGQPQNSFFYDMVENSDVVFIEVLSKDGSYALLESRLPDNLSFRLGKEEAQILIRDGEWHDFATLGSERIFVYARRMQVSHTRGGRPRRELINDPAGILLVGLSITKQQDVYEGFRQNLILQSLYIVVAATFAWGMAMSMLSRRTLAVKARFLERFQANLLDNLPDGLLTVGEDLHIQAANPAAQLMLDSISDLAGKSINELPEQLAGMIGSADLHAGVVEWRNAEVNGKQLEILISSFRGERNELMILILLRNRTRLHNLERSLAEAEKMAAIGTLAAGVAHEIRNPLAALRGFAQYFTRKFAGQQPDAEYAATMVRESDRLNRVITDLLYLARSKDIVPLKIDLQRVLNEIANLLKFDLEEKSSKLSFELQVAEVWADEDSLKQAVLNLILNSLDAIAEEQINVPDKQGNIIIRSLAAESGVLVEVEDNGAGMDEDSIAQALEAFFTSKAKGTGLGLALVNKTVREHGGVTNITSEKNKGCRVSLFFPQP